MCVSVSFQIKWVKNPKTRKYEPVFVVQEGFGAKQQVIGRASNGAYKIWNKRDVIEAPPCDQESTMVDAVEQLLRGYQMRFKATSVECICSWFITR